MKNIQVKEIYQVHGTATDIIPEDTHLENIIERFAQEPGLRGVFLIDSRQYLSGVITRADLMRLVHFQLFSGQGRPDIRVFELFHLLYAKNAKDLVTINPQALAVRETDTLQTALEKMMDYEEDVLPVVDSKGIILGDLRLSELLLKAIEVGKGSDDNEQIS